MLKTVESVDDIASCYRQTLRTLGAPIKVVDTGTALGIFVVVCHHLHPPLESAAPRPPLESAAPRRPLESAAPCPPLESAAPQACKDFSVSFWNPYWMLPSAVCGKDCFMEAAFRYNAPRKVEAGSLHLAVVACGDRLEETLTMLKSALLFSRRPLYFHIFAEDQLQDNFKTALDSWVFRGKFKYTLYPITFPSENAAEWKKLFKPCASQRLFLPLILREVDSLLYVDTDILFLRPVDDIWSFLDAFNSTQIAAMAPEHEEPRMGWYNRFARHPYYGETGINSGVMLMNITRIRRKYFKVSRPTYSLPYTDILVIYMYVSKILGATNILFFGAFLFVFPCPWNYRPDHCIYGSNCQEAEDGGIFILHGNRGVYHDNKQPTFRAVSCLHPANLRPRELHCPDQIPLWAAAVILQGPRRRFRDSNSSPI
uniref:Glucoside xylosyltransferase 1 n=1 Tax=Leptobrachium leishanense TaxID=445787 RepID=A0A8C5PNT1_9ANUR